MDVNSVETKKRWLSGKRRELGMMTAHRRELDRRIERCERAIASLEEDISAEAPTPEPTSR